jgi:hypothetical protein
VLSFAANGQDRHDRDHDRGQQKSNDRGQRQRQQVNRSGNNRPQVNNNAPINRPMQRNLGNNSGYRPRGWDASRRPYRRPPILYGGNRYYAYHAYYPHPFTAFYYGPSWHPVGFFLASLFATAIVINVADRPYHYYNGVFYEPYNSGYRVIAPPPGAYVPSIPQGYQQVAVGGQTYYYFGGAFFVMNGNNYQVVPAPAGAVVYNLPQGAANTVVANYNYVQYNGTYYQPIQINGQDAYEVVELEPDTQP